MRFRPMLGIGKNIFDASSRNRARFDSPQRCAYSEHNEVIPEGTVAIQDGDMLFCSHGCAAMAAIYDRLGTVFGHKVVVEYKQ
ncbi:hypothetical protein ACFLQN_01995 [Candidatus Aenigmatarchaeota archaeon]